MTLTIAQLVAVLILGVSSFLSGWMLRRIQAKSREAALQKHLTEANTAIPSLETNLRNRDQRIATLFAELTEWKAKIQSLETAVKRHEVETLAKERELRTARVEIDALKATVAAAPAPSKLEELEAARNALREAQAKYAEAQASCAELTAAIAERDARLAGATAPIPSFIALPVAPATESEAALNARVEMLEANVGARDAQIGALQSRLDAEVETVRSIRIELESRADEIERAHGEGAKWQARVPKLLATIKARDTVLAERDATLAERDATLAERAAALTERDAALVSRDALIAERDATLAARDAELTERAALIHQTEARVADLTSQLTMMNQQLEAAAVNHAAKLATALRLGREELDTHQASLERLQADHDAQSARSQALESELAALQKDLGEKVQAAAEEERRHASVEAGLRANAGEFEQQIAQLRQLSQQQQSAQEESLARSAEQHAQVEKQLALANEQRGQLDRRLAEAGERVAAMEKRLVEANAQTAQVEQRLAVERQRHEAASANAASLEAARAELVSQLATAHRANGELQQQIAALNGERDETEQRMQDAEREANERVAQDMEQQTIELVELRDEVRTLHTRIAPLESLLKQRDSALFERSERIEAMTSQIQALVAQTESLQATLRQRGEKIAMLERKFSDQPPPPAAPASDTADRRGDHLEQRLVAQIERNRELAKIVEERDRDLAAAAKSNELNGKSMLVLKQQLDDARQTEERLAAQLREMKAASQRAPEPDSATAARPPMSKPNGLFELPPEHVDELQQIRGIGDGFERGLNKLGVYQFTQLAGLSAAEIAWIEAHLPTFHGRIERDDWPGQAAALMAASEHAEWSLRARSAPSISSRIN